MAWCFSFFLLIAVFLLSHPIFPCLEEQQKSETDGSDAHLAQRLQALAMRSMDAINFNIEIKGDPFWQGNTFKAHDVSHQGHV